MQDEALSEAQVKRAWLILAAFIILRLAGATLWENLFGALDFEVSVPFVFFLVAVFLVMSVGLVYFGFSRWVGADLKKWWFDRATVWGDVGWGLLAVVLLAVVTVGSAIVLGMLGLTPERLGVEQSDPSSLHQLPAKLIMGLLFGFGIAAFQEETLFRGFLQTFFTCKYGNWRGNILQAGLFSIAHLGLDPFSSLPRLLFVLLFRFMTGVLLGWLRAKRGTLLAPAICHGIIG